MAARNVPKAGLEPACLATHAPETCVSTNSTTSVKKSSQQEDLLNCAKDWTFLPAGRFEPAKTYF